MIPSEWDCRLLASQNWIVYSNRNGQWRPHAIRTFRMHLQIKKYKHNFHKKEHLGDAKRTRINESKCESNKSVKPKSISPQPVDELRKHSVWPLLTQRIFGLFAIRIRAI